jgi:hypothetical protein
MAELVDALGSGPSGGNTVEVRVLFWAPYNKTKTAPLIDFRLVRFFVARKAVHIFFAGCLDLKS